MKKRVSEIIGFLVIVIAIFSVLTPAVMDPYVKRKYHNYINHTDEHDVVLLGSSLVLNGISPMNMWHDYGITSYNFGNGYSTPAVEYYMLKEILKKHTPKCIVIDTYGIWEYSGLGPVEKVGRSHELQHAQLDWMPMSLNKIQAITDLFLSWQYKAEYLWPFVRYHDRWEEIDFSTANDIDYTESIDSNIRGEGVTGVLGLGLPINLPNSSITEKEEPQSTNYKYFVKILELCNEKQIPLLCISVPHPISNDDVKKLNYVRDVVCSYPLNKCYFMYEEEIINPKLDIFKDDWHINYSGAMKVTKALGEFLDKNYDLSRHKDSQYWNEDYPIYCNNIKNHFSKLDRLVEILQLSMDRSMFSVTVEIHDESKIKDKDLFWELIQEIDVQVTYGQGEGLCRVIVKDVETDEVIVDKVIDYMK